MDEVPAAAPGGPDALWPRRTERLLLRPATPDDAERLWAYRGLPEVSRWLPTCTPTRERWITELLEPDRLGRTLVVEHAATGAVVGDLMLRVQDAWAQSEVSARARGAEAELGWALAPAWSGQGLATEALRALLDLGFGVLGLHRVIATCFTANTASWRLMERVGMRRETHARRDGLHAELGWLDSFTYALLAEEWEALRGRVDG